MKLRAATALVFVVATAGIAGGQVFFADPSLKAAVEAALWTWDPSAADMLTLTSFGAPSQGISDLTGLEQATNLQHVDLQHNEISDLSALSGLGSLQSLRLNQNLIGNITALSELTNLQTLDMHDNQIGDISALAGLTNLHTLILLTNEISDLSSLSGLVHLQTLRLDNNQISSISALSELTALQTLTASINSISSVSALAGLESLEYVNLYSNKVSDIAALGGLHNLRRLTLCANQITDISALAPLTFLSYVDLRGNPLNQDAYDVYIPQIMTHNPGVDLSYDSQVGFHVLISSTTGGSVLCPGEGQFTCDEGKTIYLEAQADSCHVFVGWSGSLSGRTNPVSLQVHQDHAIEAVFAPVCDTLYVDDNAPADPSLGDATESDPQEDGTLEHAFDRIQEAIDVATPGATIIVRPGIYRENINLLGKSIQVSGIDPNGAPFPIIDGAGTGPVVSFTSGEAPDCTLLGFVITSGRGQEAGAIACLQSSPTIANCLIVGNRASGPSGVVVYCADSHAAFSNCTIVDNVGGEQGAAMTLIDSPIVLTNSIIWGNTPSKITVAGASVPSITHTNVIGGQSDSGNIDADPLFAQRGYWADPTDLSMVASPADFDAVWVAGDYHLKSQAGRWAPETETWVWNGVTSPCIDAGDPAVPVGAEPVPNGGIINMGAYGGTAKASKTYRPK